LVTGGTGQCCSGEHGSPIAEALGDSFADWLSQESAPIQDFAMAAYVVFSSVSLLVVIMPNAAAGLMDKDRMELEFVLGSLVLTLRSIQQDTGIMIAFQEMQVQCLAPHQSKLTIWRR
jgi:hypothetical protein